ncbi:DNA uptake protein ComE-like DNA-binding protein [Balneicella halophila]|uniref:DNA uptake protein ComE-like DNA-binding protein n=1 Tax=Balneicella halophila TaxID=1537566 RepID=A0A7L4USA9_BALHA|nr:helix-hairpin-helix domain-containing protein [Balneicella halophila]PVX52362.1 DNA uptake protein ComE-like DNA-binding protein [Balneicella halophila]
MFAKLFSRLRTYFYYNRKELNGVGVLMLLLVLLFAGLYFYKKYFFQEIDTSYFQYQIDSLERVGKRDKTTYQYFAFNPNTVKIIELEKLGFSKKQIRNLVNYRNAGGYFYKKEDFRKLYFVTDSIYKVYEPFLRLNDNENWQKTKNKIVKNKTGEATSEKEIDSLFYFDPNLISTEEWLALGVTKKVAQIIANYKKKGGHFYVSEDLKKIYGLSEEKYNQLLPYIRIEEKEDVNYTNQQDTISTIYDLNTISEEELLKLHVSLSMSRKLINFRNKLGGYASMAQLLELYNIRERDLNIIKKYCEIRSPVMQININTATEEEIYKHPYLDFHDAQAIIRYRKRKGDYERVTLLKNRKILTNKTFDKVKPYLKVKE